MRPLTLGGASGATASVVVEPVVLFTICDAYIRRNEGAERVIGALLGKANKEGEIRISSCFAVPHMEQGEVKLDIDHLETLQRNFKKVYPREVLVGWFSTSCGVTVVDTLLHEFWASKCTRMQEPVYLTVDTTLRDEKLSITAHVARTLTLGGQQVAMEFREVPSMVNTSQAERVGREVFASEYAEKVVSPLDSLEASVDKLQESLDKTYAYVDDVAAGRKKGSATLGRYLADTMQLVPHLRAEEVQSMLGESQDDLVLVTFLTHMLRAQIAIAEKLGTLQLPLV